jgi:DNA modification methylase
MVKPFYEREGIVIFNGDCREVVPGLDVADLLLTDPPFGIGFASQPTKWQRRAGKNPESWDDTIAEGFEALLPFGRQQVIWGVNYYCLPPTRGWLSWFKPDAPPSMGNFELAWTSLDRTSRQFSYSIAATNAERVGHPTQKPLALILWCLGFFPKAQTVLDPYCGSGTTLVACAQLGRRGVGVEINEKYCEIAAKRIDAALDQPPHHHPRQPHHCRATAGYEVSAHPVQRQRPTIL